MKSRLFGVVTCLVAFASAGASASAHKPGFDAKLYTTYGVAADGTSIDYEICGPGGCRGAGNIAPFDRACAIMEGKPSTQDHVTTRAIYVLDKRSAERSEVTFYVYTRTDTITRNGIDFQIVLTAKIPLGIQAGSKARCFMAANDRFVYVGTDKSTTGLSIDKASLSLDMAGGENIQSITASDKGFVCISIPGGFVVYDPFGTVAEAGGSMREDLANTINAFTTN